MNLAIWLNRNANLRGDAAALCLGAEVCENYSGFAQKAASVAGALKSKGVRPGDRVALFAKNIPEYLIAFYGIWHAGAAVVPVNAKLHAREAAFILENSGAELVFVTEDPGAPLSEITDVPLVDLKGEMFSEMTLSNPVPLTDRAPNDLAWLFYTSGTTGQPKGVQITHGMLSVMTLNYLADVDQVYPDDAILYAAPISHAAGIYNMVHVLKGAQHLFPVSAGFDADEVLDLANEHGPISMFMAPTMVRRFTDVAGKGRPSGWHSHHRLRRRPHV